jgi:hypothetical protein
MPITLSSEMKSKKKVITRVEYFANDSKINDSTSAPFSLQWNPELSGDYKIVAKALTSDGSQYTSFPITIHIIPFNQPPVASVVAVDTSSTSAQGNTTDGKEYTFTADASDPDSPIDHVEFFIDGKMVFVDNESPYSLTTVLPGGTHTISVLAVDNKGKSTRSAPVVVFVNTINPITLTKLLRTGGV